MNRIKKILLAFLGEKRYLQWLAHSFQPLYRWGWLGKSYQDIYFLRHILRPGYYCLDIGAHLGYYTLEMARLVGPLGRIFAIEPISKFHNTLQGLLLRKSFSQVTLFRYALGGQGEEVQMGIPRVGGMKKFAYARVLDQDSGLEFVETEQVPNRTGDRLFGDLPRLDFIKCDVEGLEVPVFGSMMAVLRQHHPIILCELADRGERIRLGEMLSPLGYRAYFLAGGELDPLDLDSEIRPLAHNHYFIPEGRLDGLPIFRKKESAHA
jgi:FkbM family methyltransferase